MKISIVTVVLNARSLLKQTIESVFQQTYANKEYIIVDGGSTDGTLKVIKEHEHKIDCWISEKDNGVYHGMNRALNLVTGDWVIFMNAGDIFLGQNTIKNSIASLRPDADFVYGHYFYQTPNGYTELIKSAPFKQIWQQLISKRINRTWLKSIPCHQAIYAKARIIKKLKFNTRFQIAADHDLMFSGFAANYKFIQINMPIAIYMAGGFSQKRQIQGLLEKWRISKLVQKGIRINLFFMFLVSKACLEKIIRKHKLFFIKYQKLKSVLAKTIKPDSSKSSPISNPRESRNTIIFLHIPKTAGTSLQQIIRSQYKGKFMYELNNFNAFKSMQHFKSMDKQIKQQYRIILGHMWFGLHHHLSQTSTYITVLRDPLQRVISHYLFVKRTPHHYLHQSVISKKLSLQDYLESKISPELNNGQTRLLAGEQSRDIPFGKCPIELLAKAKTHLKEHFLIVGIQEKFEKTLYLVNKILDWPISFFSQNVNQNKLNLATIPSETMDTIKQYNHLDLELYAYAQEIFNNMYEYYCCQELSSQDSQIHDNSSRSRRSLINN